jgi:hypothetical protein
MSISKKATNRRFWLWVVFSGPLTGCAVATLFIVIGLTWPGYLQTDDLLQWLDFLGVPIIFGAMFAVALKRSGQSGWVKALTIIPCLAFANLLAFFSIFAVIVHLPRSYPWKFFWEYDLYFAPLYVGLVFGLISVLCAAALYRQMRKLVLIVTVTIVCGATALSFPLLLPLESIFGISKGVTGSGFVAYPITTGLVHGAFAAVTGRAFLRESDQTA